MCRVPHTTVRQQQLTLLSTSHSYNRLRRRFGHAATDRQDAYLSPAEIAAAAEHNVLENMTAWAVNQGVATLPDLQQLMAHIVQTVQHSFDTAVRSQHNSTRSTLPRTAHKLQRLLVLPQSQEPKVTSREAMVEQVSAPLQPPPASATTHMVAAADVAAAAAEATGKSAKREKGAPRKQQMRLHMSKVIAECMEERPNMVYVCVWCCKGCVGVVNVTRCYACTHTHTQVHWRGCAPWRLLPGYSKAR